MRLARVAKAEQTMGGGLSLLTPLLAAFLLPPLRPPLWPLFPPPLPFLGRLPFLGFLLPLPLLPFLGFLLPLPLLPPPFLGPALLLLRAAAAPPLPRGPRGVERGASSMLLFLGLPLILPLPLLPPTPRPWAWPSVCWSWCSLFATGGVSSMVIFE